MIAPELLHRIKTIEIQTKRLLQGTLAGNKRSAEKGYGLDFDQIREYQLGDDIRFIDWKSSARMHKLLVKQYRQERTRTLLLVVDCSSSMFFASGDQLKYDCVAEVACILSLIAHYSQDQVGLLLFSDTVEKVIPPRSGLQQVRTIMQTLLEQKSTQKSTNMTEVLRQVVHMKRKDTLVCILSDLIADQYHTMLSVIARRYDTLVMRCLDKSEKKLPPRGLLRVQDIELGRSAWCSFAHIQAQGVLENRLCEQAALLKRYGIKVFDINPAGPYKEDVIRFLQQKMIW